MTAFLGLEASGDTQIVNEPEEGAPVETKKES